MGSSSAARLAGKIPKNRPTPTETEKATTTQTGETCEGRAGKKVRTARLIRLPLKMPITPPVPVSVIASIRNCARISRRLAPTALRMPISRVRSVTETSMIFMTPMPPTSRPMEEMTIVRMTIAPVSCFQT